MDNLIFIYFVKYLNKTRLVVVVQNNREKRLFLQHNIKFCIQLFWCTYDRYFISRVTYYICLED